MTSSGTVDDWRAYGPAALPRVLAAALDRFAEHGYHGTSIRDLATVSGLSVPGLYHHYRSKQDMLLAHPWKLLAADGDAPEQVEEEPGDGEPFTQHV